MVQIAGKYQNERNENFVEFLTSMNSQVTEDFAKKMDSERPSLNVTLNGDVCTISNSSGKTQTFTLGKSFDDDSSGAIIKCLAKLDGNKIDISAENGDATLGRRVYEFTDTGLIVHYYSATTSGRRIYKRL